MSGRFIARLALLLGVVGLATWGAWTAGHGALADAPPVAAAAAIADPPAAPNELQPAAPAVAAPEAAVPALTTTTIEIAKRDTLVAALRRNDVDARQAHEIATALQDAGADLRRVRPGDTVDLWRAADGGVARLVFAASPWLRFEAAAAGDGWQVQRVETEPEVRIEARAGEVRNSLWEAVESGVVAAPVLLDLVQLFESDFDFTADARSGDRFRLLVEARYANGAFVEYGRILAAQYFSDHRTYTGVAFEQGGRVSYYDPQGRSLKKMFLRSPLQFTRISSRFTYRRPHPILGGVRPHLAIDYAAPTGTPVWAVADGVVRSAGRNGGNGIQVVVRHRAGYDTYYNHLSGVARGVRKGGRVNQKQVIGYVGATGLATGPHLDYRVARNGTFVNPLSEKFLPGDPVPAGERARFLAHAGELTARLAAESPLPSGVESAPVTW